MTFSEQHSQNLSMQCVLCMYGVFCLFVCLFIYLFGSLSEPILAIGMKFSLYIYDH